MPCRAAHASMAHLHQPPDRGKRQFIIRRAPGEQSTISHEQSVPLADRKYLRRMSVAPKIPGVVNFCLSVLVALFGIAIVLTTLERRPWFDEFVTIALTTDTSPRE